MRLRTVPTIALLSVIFLNLAGNALAVQTNIWTSTGPQGAVITALAMSGNSNILYAGTQGGGIYRSGNSGATWTVKNTGLTSTAINTVAIDSSDPNVADIVYAGTAAGIFKTTNGGTSWQNVGTTLTNPGSPVKAIGIDKSSTPTKIYIGTGDRGVFVSSDGGTSWISRNTGLSSLQVAALAIDPVTPANLYAAVTGRGVFQSSDSGGTWALLTTTDLTDTDIRALALDPATPANIYAGTAAGGIFTFTLGAGSWGTANTGLTNQSINTLLIGTSSFVGTDAGLFRSLDKGGTWTDQSAGLDNAHTLALASVAPANTPIVFAGTGSGVYISTNGGDSWSQTNSGMAATDIASVALSPTYYLAGSAGGGVYRSPDSGGSWAPTNSGLTNYQATVAAFEPGSTTNAYVGTAGSGIFRTTDGGTNWGSSGLPGETVLSLAIDNATPATAYAGTATGLSKTVNNGGAWSTLSIMGLSLRVSAVALDPATPSSVFAGDESGLGVYMSTDSGTTWSAFNTGLSGNGKKIKSLSIVGTDIYAGTADGVFKSPVAAPGWSASGLSGNDVRAMAGDVQVVAAAIYGGGASISTDGGLNWLTINSGLANLNLQSMALDSAPPRKLFAGSTGGGVSAITLSGTAVVTPSPFNFGYVNLNATDTRPFTLTNTGTVPLTVSAISLSGTNAAMFDIPAGSNQCLPLPRVLNRNDQCLFNVSFTPTSDGAKTATLSVTSDDAQTAKLDTTLTGNGVSPPISSITAPAPNAIIAGITSRVTGTSAAVGTGITISEVRVSTDNGVTWQLATREPPPTGNNTWDKWYFDWTLPADGVYTVQSRSQNNLGFYQTPVTSVTGVAVNNLPPVVTISAPAHNGAIKGVTYTVRGTALDAGAGILDETVIRISISGGPDQQATTYNSATGAWTYDWTLPVDGSYTISVKATDKGGRTSTPVTITVVVDNSTIPTSIITAPVPNEKIKGSSYLVTGTADDSTGSGVQKVEICMLPSSSAPPCLAWVTACDLATAPSCTAWSYTWSLPASYLTYTIESRATDRAGNVQSPTFQVAGDIVDNVPPVATIDPPPAYLTGTAHTFTGSASDTGLGIKQVQFSVNNGTWVNAVDTSLAHDWSTWSYAWTLPADNSYAVKVRAIDQLDNIQTTPASVTVAVNNDPPVPAITSPANGSATSGTGTMITGTALDPGAGVQRVEVSTDGGISWTVATDDAVAPARPWSNWSYNWTFPAPDAPFTIAMRAFDNAGKESTHPSVAVIVDNTAPTAAITAPANGAQLNGITYLVTGTATDPGAVGFTASGVRKVEISVDDGTSWAVACDTVQPATPTCDNWSYSWTLPLQNGVSYKLRSRATDRANSLGSTSAAASVTIYNTPPLSVVSSVTPALVSPYVNYRGTALTVNGTASDQGLGVNRVQVSLDGGLTWSDATDMAVSPATPWSSWRLAWNGPADGSYTIRSRATNLVNLVETPGAGLTVTIDNTPPVTTFSQAPLPYSNITAPTVNYSASESVTRYSCRLDSQPAYDCAPPQHLTGLANGAHAFTVQAFDLAGNAETAPASFAWVVDTVAPTVTRTQPAQGEQFSVAGTITITFKEDVDPATVHTNTVLLTKGTGTVGGTVTYDTSTKTATFRPKDAGGQPTSLEYTTDYTLTLTTGIGDMSGNPLATPYVVSFKTDPEGDIDQSGGEPTIADALLCLKATVGRATPSATQLRHGDVAPLKGGRPSPDGMITVGDAVVILERILGVSRW